MPFFENQYQWLAYAGSILSAVLATYIIFLLFQKRKKKSSKIIPILIYTIIFLDLAAIIDFVFFTIGGLNNAIEETSFIAVGSNLSFSCSAISNIFLLKFSKEVFYENKSKPSFYILYVLEMLTIPLFFILQFAIDDSTIPLLVHVVCALAIYTILSKNAFQLRTRIFSEDPSNRVALHSLSFMGGSGIAFFIAVSMFVSHEIFILIGIADQYTTVMLGWVLGGIAAILTYIGYIVPDWARHRWE